MPTRDDRCGWCGEQTDLVPVTYLYSHKAECRDWDGCCDRLAAVIALLERIDFTAVQLGRIRLAA